MSYVALARKYRPQVFDKVIGQEAIATTLKNAIRLDRVHHAFLFAGPRGVGKTSMARIFAKALNCAKGPTEEPCGACPACRDIEEGRSLDVIEIDGASTRGIDDVREIRESIKFSPSYGHFKIYIIDEVHQITPDGFNALLKTLEEPPPHAKFVFATTAPQKIPPTILSRCQRFDFRRIPTEAIAGALGAIAEKEGFAIAKDAVLEIARAADGSLRDAQSMLDQISSFSKDRISFEDVSQALGSWKPEDFFKLFEAVADQDGEKVLNLTGSLVDGGQDPAFFLERCLEHVRNLMVLKVSEELAGLIEGSDHYQALVKDQAARFSRAELFYFFGLMVQGLQNVRRLKPKRAALEMALLKCALREPMIQLDHPRQSPATAARAEEPKAGPARDPNLRPSEPGEPPEDEAAESLDMIWPNFLRRIRAEKMSAATFLQEARPVGMTGNQVIIGFPAGFSFHAEALRAESNLRLIEKHLSDLLQRETRVEFRIFEDEAAHGTPKETGEASAEAAAQATPDSVKSAIGIFGGRVLKRTP